MEESLEITRGMSVEDREKLRLIWNLKYNLKSVVILYYVEGYSVKETADILRISETAVKKRLQRARECLEKLGSDYEGGIVSE